MTRDDFFVAETSHGLCVFRWEDVDQITPGLDQPDVAVIWWKRADASLPKHMRCRESVADIAMRVGLLGVLYVPREGDDA